MKGCRGSGESDNNIFVETEDLAMKGIYYSILCIKLGREGVLESSINPTI